MKTTILLFRPLRFLISLVLTVVVPFSAFCQLPAGPYWEAGITVGPMVFLGDLGGNFGQGATFLKDYNLPVTRLSEGAYLADYPTQWLGFRLALDHGSLAGNDALIKANSGEAVSRKNRNLNFRSQIYEALLIMEVYPTVFLEEDPDDVVGKIRPYGLLGVGVFHFNPQGLYTDPDGNSTWVDLRPLHTEGEGFPEYPDRKMYSLTQLNIPIGVGAKYFISDKVSFSVEVLHRKTFTYYIDDVSTTYINPDLFDKYLSPSQAVIAKAVSNKSVDGYKTPNYGPGNKRGDHTQYNAYFGFNLKLGIRLGSGGDRWRNSTHCPLLRF